MPLIICAVFFTLLFALEGFWRLCDAFAEAERLSRYQAVEHPRSHTSDEYLDRL